MYSMEITLDNIMEQAQVYASAYSLIGGNLDDGSMYEVAEKEKEELKKMIKLFTE